MSYERSGERGFPDHRTHVHVDFLGSERKSAEQGAGGRQLAQRHRWAGQCHTPARAWNWGDSAGCNDTAAHVRHSESLGLPSDRSSNTVLPAVIREINRVGFVAAAKSLHY